MKLIASAADPRGRTARPRRPAYRPRGHCHPRIEEKLPSGGVDKPVRLWQSRAATAEADADHCRRSYLHRFDIKRTFRFIALG